MGEDEFQDYTSSTPWERHAFSEHMLYACFMYVSNKMHKVALVDEAIECFQAQRLPSHAGWWRP